MNYYKLYIKIIFIVKILFFILASYELYVKHKDPKNTKKIEEVKYMKERVEVIFKGLMSVLLICLFNPRTSKEIMKLDFETRVLLYLFGFILILTADWKSIFHNIPKTFQILQSLLGRVPDQKNE